MPLFETIKTNAWTPPKNELQQWALVWQLLLWYLLRNCKETAAKPPLPPKTAICRRIFFLPFLAELDNLESFEAILCFSKKMTPTFLHLTLVIFQISYYSTKKVFSANVRVIFLEKNKLGSINSEMYNSARNGKKKFAADGGFWR